MQSSLLKADATRERRMMDVKVLGTGCAKCQKLFEATKAAVQESGVEADLRKVEKLDEIVPYGVVMMPGLVIAGEVKSAGRIPDVKQIAAWLTEAAAKG
jgi:small redox-active disulfide protein 2